MLNYAIIWLLWTYMDSSTSPQTRPRHLARTILLTFVGTLLGFCFAIFLIFLAYYLWQFKYGSLADNARAMKEFKQSRFTFAVSGNAKAPNTPADLDSFIRANNAITGNKKSKLTILAFVDFECPFSQAGYPLFKTIVDTYGSAAKIVVKHLPLPAIHPHAMDAALASACAGEQGKFFEYYDKLFTAQKLTRADLVGKAAELGLEPTKFNSCLKTNKYREDIERDMLDAAELGVRGTPTYFIGSEVIEGVADRASWDTAVLKNLKNK